MLFGPVNAQNIQAWKILLRTYNTICEPNKTYLQVCDCVFDGVQKIKVVNKIRRRFRFKVKSEKKKIGSNTTFSKPPPGLVGMALLQYLVHLLPCKFWQDGVQLVDAL